MLPLVSIVIPLYNKEKSILEAVMSALLQSYSRIEIIVVDDGSTDKSASMVPNDKKVQLYCQENKGVSSARNQGVEHAKGDFVLFLDADDFLHKNAIEDLVDVVGNEDIAVGNFKVFRGDAELEYLNDWHNGIIHPPVSADIFLQRRFFLRAGNFICRRQILDKYSFDKNLSYYEDLKLFLKLISTCRIASTNKIVMTYRDDSGGLSQFVAKRDGNFLLEPLSQLKELPKKLIKYVLMLRLKFFVRALRRHEFIFVCLNSMALWEGIMFLLNPLNSLNDKK